MDRCGLHATEAPAEQTVAGVVTVHMNPLPRSRMGRMAWSWLRHPVKSREFPAKHERLVTAEDLLLFGV
ncbi:hypothetical protein BST44_27870 [Mycobacterium scrofulaceum]|uniref:Uncharacterized protein n=2 Tax=Mycobacterium TaxID=1763 RepID=A0A1X0JV05_MYCSC|nr:hypothetical protein BST44_27870 [Mycobacterium scrofulaceum]